MNENGDAARELNPLEIVFLGLASVVAVMGGVGWLVGSIAGLVFGGGWPHLGLADSLAALLELPNHVSDPRAAWPVDVRHRLPGAAAMYVSGFVVVAATVALSGRTIGHVITWLDTQEEAEIMDALIAAEIPAATHAFEASIGRDMRQRSSVYATAETILEAYADPGVLLRSKTDEIRPDELLDGEFNTLYLSATVREQRRLRPVFVALLESVIEEAYARSAATGKPLDPPLLVVLDEAANVAPLPDLDVIAATGAGHGVQLVTVLQDLAQAHDRWGRDRADTIVNNHRARVIGGGIADERTLDYVGKILGDTEVRQQSSTSAELGRHSTTTSTTYRSLAPANFIREAKHGSAMLLYGSLPPAQIAFRPWYADRALTDLARCKSKVDDRRLRRMTLVDTMRRCRF